MQIDPTRLHPASAPGTDAVSAPGAASTAAPGAADAAGAADQLALSQQAAEVRAAHEALAALPDTRADLVARLKSEIEAGTYRIDPEAIAEKMVP